jgi:hypothetical protein
MKDLVVIGWMIVVGQFIVPSAHLSDHPIGFLHPLSVSNINPTNPRFHIDIHTFNNKFLKFL